RVRNGESVGQRVERAGLAQIGRGDKCREQHVRLRREDSGIPMTGQNHSEPVLELDHWNVTCSEHTNGRWLLRRSSVEPVSQILARTFCEYLVDSEPDGFRGKGVRER